MWRVGWRWEDGVVSSNILISLKPVLRSDNTRYQLHREANKIIVSLRFCTHIQAAKSNYFLD